jgi:hypothetical protein
MNVNEGMGNINLDFLASVICYLEIESRENYVVFDHLKSFCLPPMCVSN